MSLTELFYIHGAPPESYFASLGEVFRPDRRQRGPLEPKIEGILKTIPLGWPARLQEHYGYQFLATETTDPLLGRIASRLRGGPIDMDSLMRHDPDLVALERLVVNGPLAMKAARAAHAKLAVLLKKASPFLLTADESQHLNAFVDVLGQLIEKRHGIREPEIVRLVKDDPLLGSPGLLEQIVRHEQVHKFGAYVEMQEDLYRRLGWAGLGAENRAIYAKLDPYNPEDVMMSIQAVFFDHKNLPGNIGDVLKGTNPVEGPVDAVAFVSISSGRVILSPFGEEFIRQTALTIHKERPEIKFFYTVSPMREFRKWIDKALNEEMWENLGGQDALELTLPQLREQLAAVSSNAELQENSDLFDCMQRLAFVFITGNVRNNDGTFDWFNPISGKIHLAYGAEIERINFAGSPTDYSWKESYGFMANYCYRLILDGVLSTARLEANKIKHTAGIALLTENMAPFVGTLAARAPVGPYSRYLMQDRPPRLVFS